MDFEIPDWTAFRNIDTLAQKGGVSRRLIPRLVGKELVDNALDATEECGGHEVAIGSNGNYYYVKDNGPGINREKIEEIFSINRPMVSSKRLRLPTRGALGNGLRVVTGAIIATGGDLQVISRGKIYKVIPQDDGTANVVDIGYHPHKGTQINFNLGKYHVDFDWGNIALKYNRGTKYKGNTSPYWYTSESFYELFQSYKGTVRELVEQFDGCTGAKAGQLAKAYKGYAAKSLSFDQAEQLLQQLRHSLKQVKADRLGSIGKMDDWLGYYQISGTFIIESIKGRHNAIIPFILEVWANPADEAKITVLVNKTPITGDMYISVDGKTKLNIGGCGIRSDIKAKPADILINIITPYIPMTSDGKEPNFYYIGDPIADAINRAVNRSYKAVKIESDEKIFQNRIVLEHLNDGVAKASGNNKHRYNERQLYYAIRPYVLDLGKEMTYNYFETIITNYEFKNGEIPGMFRDDRGSLFTPHTGEKIPIGTLSVEEYIRPELTYNKLIYIEKEGFNETLLDVQFPEKHDCALLTSKGYSSRAARDLIDRLSESGEEITVFCLHDADSHGTMIYESLQNATKARPERKVKIINLGLDPEDALKMNLQIERVESEDEKAVADYLDDYWKKWLQSNRVELNAMTTPQFIDWLEKKMQPYKKIVPNTDKLKETLAGDIKDNLRQKIRDDILRNAGYEQQVEEAFEKLQSTIETIGGTLQENVQLSLETEPVLHWIDPIKDIAKDIVYPTDSNP